jgi:RNA 3'-terminal phosphate cyclase
MANGLKTEAMIVIDGSEGEGGGQILRTSLALSLVTGQPVRMNRIRARRQKPGLLRQHLTAVEAAKAVGCAEVTGAALSSQTVEFRPGRVTPGNYRFAVGTAGSATLVLQTVLPALLSAPGPSTLTLEGGTHNPLTAVFTGFGERGRPAEEVAKSAVEAAKAWIESGVPADEHLADQLLVPMALAGDGTFRTTKPSLHTTTNAEVIRRFVPVAIHMEQESDLAWRIEVGKG